MHPFSNLELPGFVAAGPDAWQSADHVMVKADYFPLVPDLPAPLSDLPALRRAMAHKVASQGGCLIEGDVVPIGGIPAFRQLVKMPIPNRAHGQGFLGGFIVPRATCSTVLRVQAVEQGTTGIREAMVLAQVGLPNYFRPHPFAPDVSGGLPFHAGDDPAYDAQFPEHPLTRVRQVLAQLAAQATLHPGFVALPPFGA